MFLHFNEDELNVQIHQIINEFARQSVINSNDNFLSINKSKVRILQLWSAGMQEILQRYYITVTILQKQPAISRAELEKESQLVAQRLSVLHGINANSLIKRFSSFIANLKSNVTLMNHGYTVLDKIEELASTLSHLISTEICLTVKGTIEKSEDLSS